MDKKQPDGVEREREQKSKALQEDTAKQQIFLKYILAYIFVVLSAVMSTLILLMQKAI